MRALLGMSSPHEMVTRAGGLGSVKRAPYTYRYLEITVLEKGETMKTERTDATLLMAAKSPIDRSIMTVETMLLA